MAKAISLRSPRKCLAITMRLVVERRSKESGSESAGRDKIKLERDLSKLSGETRRDEGRIDRRQRSVSRNLSPSSRARGCAASERTGRALLPDSLRVFFGRELSATRRVGVAVCSVKTSGGIDAPEIAELSGMFLAVEPHLQRGFAVRMGRMVNARKQRADFLDGAI